MMNLTSGLRHGVAAGRLTTLLAPGPRPAPGAPPGWTPARSLVVGDALYIRNSDGREELYDLADDRAEADDLAGAAAARDQLRRCRLALERLIPVEAARR